MNLTITEEPALEALEPHQYGQVTVWQDCGDLCYQAAVRPGLSAEEFSKAESHIQRMLDRLLETWDPERHGWAPSGRGPGYWYMTLATYVLPDMSFLDDVDIDWPPTR